MNTKFNLVMSLLLGISFLVCFASGIFMPLMRYHTIIAYVTMGLFVLHVILYFPIIKAHLFPSMH